MQYTYLFVNTNLRTTGKAWITQDNIIWKHNQQTVEYTDELKKTEKRLILRIILKERYRILYDCHFSHKTKPIWQNWTNKELNLHAAWKSLNLISLWNQKSKSHYVEKLYQKGGKKTTFHKFVLYDIQFRKT